MTHPLQTNLIITDSEVEETAGFRCGLEVIVLINAGLIGKSQNTLFGKQVIEFEFAELDVDPTAAKQIIQAGEDGFEVKGPGVIRGREHVERNVFGKSAAGVKVQPAPVEAMRGDSRFFLTRGRNRRIIDAHAIDAFAMPDRGDAESHRPIGGSLIDG